MKTTLVVDLANLTIKQAGASRTATFDEMFIERDDAGKQLAKISDTRTFRFPEAARAGLERSGLRTAEDIPLADGTTRITIIVRDPETGHIGSLTVPVSRLRR